MLPVLFEEFELVCILCCCFSFHYHCQLIKIQHLQKSGGGAAAAPSPPGFYGHVRDILLERSHDFMFRMIVGSEHGTIVRTIIVAIIVPCSEWLYVVKFDSQPEHD